jgi:tetratricopeptide (TPR) repeat protein
MAKKRLTRKQLLKEPDEFITTTGQVIRWAREHTKPLTYGCAGFFAVVILITVISVYQERRAQNAAALLGQSTAKYQAGLTAGSEDKALDVVRADFEQLIDSYSGQPAGRMGRIIFAHICLSGGAYDDAVTHYSGALKDFDGDPSLLNIILNGLGSALQQKGDDAAAAGYYQQLIDADSAVLKDAALFNLGVLYGKMGKTAEGRKAYEQLAADYPDSFYANLIKELM